jgi:hypothetical protein
MTRLDNLPPDLRATLSLLVDRGKSYAQVADLLGIPQQAVRDRAHAALDALADDQDDPSAPPAAPAAQRSARPAPRPARASAQAALPASRRAGAILLAVIVAIVIVAVILITGSGGSGSHKASHSSSTATKSTAGKTPAVTKQITLRSSEPGSKTIGLVEVLAEGGQRAFYIAAEHLPPSHGFFYAVWLYNSPSHAEAISKSPSVGSNERLQGGALLPTNASDYHEILLTRETSERPTQPGPVVLRGAFSLG